MTAVAQERRYVINRSGVRVGVDIPRDLSEATFNKLVLDGDITPDAADESKPKTSK